MSDLLNAEHMTWHAFVDSGEVRIEAITDSWEHSDHDVWLTVSGNFGGQAETLAWATELAELLNSWGKNE